MKTAKSMMVLMTLHIGGLIEVNGKVQSVEAWVYPDQRWNGFHTPMMTETQLDAFIKLQDPTLSPERGECDKVFFDKVHGYCIQDSYGDCHELTRLKAKTPDGQMLYDMSNDWAWMEAGHDA